MKKQILVLVIIILGMVLAGCAEEAKDTDPADSVEKYIKAMVEKNEKDFNAVICEDFQATAKTNFDSFGSVEASLKDVQCTASDKDDDSANVTCTGSIAVVYNGENTRDLPQEGPVYQMVNDDDTWKICGITQ